ncbi:MAG: hypothetical protein HZB10_01065 [Candidatus Yonathbacteria bacterium]|nr:hypothetical protein [Candidatus Yonathbacteria bacterium]
MKRPIILGILGGLALFALYFSILTAISGLRFTWYQFGENWYWIIALASGFGIQIGLFTVLRARHALGSGKVVAVSGTTSTAAMIACCSHYAVNILPFLGATGLVMFVAQYQTELFVVGVVSNLLGIGYLLQKMGIIRFQYGT